MHSSSGQVWWQCRMTWSPSAKVRLNSTCLPGYGYALRDLRFLFLFLLCDGPLRPSFCNP